MAAQLELMLFTHDADLARKAEASGIDRIVVDFENREKIHRQSGHGLEINQATLADLKKVRAAIKIPILVRVNPIFNGSREEIHSVVGEGADIIMLPMFRTMMEVDTFINISGDTVKKSLLFETKASVTLAQELAPLSFDEYYIGLNDMAIDFQLPSAFDVLKLDVISRIRNAIPHRRFGFGGITIVGKGEPLKSTEIMDVMAQKGCTLAILRRAFKRDVCGRSMEVEVKKIRDYYVEEV